MSTNAAIVIKVKDGYLAVYNHWDGYPDYLGTLLNAHYRSYDKVKRLIELGAISSLNEAIEPRKGELHTFDKPLEYVTIAYARDRGEVVKIQKAKSLTEIKYGEYLYLYIPSTREWETYAGDWEVPGKWKKVNIDYDKNIKEWITKGHFSIHPRGYDRVTGERTK